MTILDVKAISKNNWGEKEAKEQLLGKLDLFYQITRVRPKLRIKERVFMEKSLQDGIFGWFVSL